MIAWRQCEVEPWLVKARLLFFVTNVHFAPDQYWSVTKCKCAPWKARLWFGSKNVTFLKTTISIYIWRFTCVLGHNRQIQRGRSTFPEGEPQARAATTPGWWLSIMDLVVWVFFKKEVIFRPSLSTHRPLPKAQFTSFRKGCVKIHPLLTILLSKFTL